MKRIVVDKPVDIVYAEDADLERGVIAMYGLKIVGFLAPAKGGGIQLIMSTQGSDNAYVFFDMEAVIKKLNTYSFYQL